MARIRPISCVPEKGDSIAPEVKLTFIIQVLTAATPIFVNKDPQNPTPPTTTT